VRQPAAAMHFMEALQHELQNAAAPSGAPSSNPQPCPHRAVGHIEKPTGAWTERSFEFANARVAAGDLCRDGDRRTLLAAGDIVENRPRFLAAFRSL
jgi:hypothetical protein